MARGTCVRLVLLLSIGLALLVAFSSLYLSGLGDSSAWTVVAACLAVIAAVVSAWTAHDVLELQRAAQQPYPYPSIDCRSRYQIMQLKLTNYGGTAAHKVWLRWEGKALANTDGEVVRLGAAEDGSEIPILLPNETVSVLVDSNWKMFKQYDDLNFEGTVCYEDVLGKTRSHAFWLSAEKFRKGLNYDEEEPRTHFELQKIPKELQRIRKEIKALGSDC